MDLKKIHIRETTDDDLNDIMEVEKKAFGYDKEAELVAQLFADKSSEPLLSLLAYYKDEAIGHILFTRAYLNESESSPLVHILAPLAVKPEYQKQGIGGMLIEDGLKKLKVIGSEMVFVLGHPGYYPKFGFKNDAELLGFPAPFPIPLENAAAWMVLPLIDKGLSIHAGKVICSHELNKPEHWRE